MPLNTIVDSQSMRDILKHISFDSVLMLDLDNTVMESSLELGSDQWFVQLCVHASSEISAMENPIALVIALYHEIQKIVRAQAVEEVTIKLIKILQDIGVPIIAITARDSCLQEATTRQLRDIGIHLCSKGISNQTFPIVQIGKPNEEALFDDGIIYCSGKDKGACFQAFLNATAINPKHVVMVDDKRKHLEHVMEVAESSNIRFNGIRYGYLDDKVASFEIKEAHMQLISVQHHLPSDVQEHIQSLNIPKKHQANAADYLRFFYINTGAASTADANQPGVLLAAQNLI